MALNFEQRGEQSLLSGTATVSTPDGLVSFSVKSAAQPASAFNVTATVRGLKPKTLALALPSFDSLQKTEVLLDADVDMRIGRQSTIETASALVTVGAGNLYLPNLDTLPFAFEGGMFRLDYDGTQQSLRLQPSVLKWGGSRLTLVGLAGPRPDATGTKQATNQLTTPPPPWEFQLQGRDGLLVASDLELTPIAMRRWQASGGIDWGQSRLTVSQFEFTAGGATVGGAMEFSGDGAEPGTKITAATGAMPLTTMLSLWPAPLNGEVREWVAKQTIDGRIESGTLEILTGQYLDRSKPESFAYGANGPYRLAMTVDARDVTLVPRNDLQPVVMPVVGFALQNEAMALRAPQGQITFEAGHVISLKDGQYTAQGIYAPDATSQTTFTFQTNAAGLLGILEQPAFADGGRRLEFKNPKGAVEGDVRIVMPLTAGATDLDAPARGEQVSTSGQVRLSEGQAADVLGDLDVDKANIVFNFDDRAVNASGNVLLGKVPAKLTWQKIFAADADRQPPLRISAKLTEADRKRLDMDASGAIRGGVPLELTVTRFDKETPDVHLRADLSSSELILDNLSWKKAPGRSAFLDADIVETRSGLELRNLTVAGDDIAVEGIAKFDKRKRLVAFDFPNFSLNLVTRFGVSGTRSKSNIWKITAKGPRYDGRNFFRSLFSVGSNPDRSADQSGPAQAGIDLSADIKTVIGFAETSLHGL
ncbi:MAG: hypothetical protein AAFO75_07730, partial [Pseudomonadota bacterium]